MTKKLKEKIKQAVAANEKILEILNERRLIKNRETAEWMKREKLGIAHPRPRRSHYLG